MLYGMIFLGSLLYHAGRMHGEGFIEITLSACGSGLVLSAFLAVLGH